MLIKSRHILYGINILVLLLFLIIVFIPNNILRLIIGLPAVLFFPGYAVVAAILPRKTTLNGIERLALSFGLSISVVVLIGLGLNYTPWGLRLYPILISLASFIFAISVIAWLRMRVLPPEEGISLHIEFKVSSLSELIPFKATRDKIISGLLVIAVIGAIGTLVYVINQPRNTEPYTEFYILKSEDSNADYPRVVVLGGNIRVILEIVNHEYKSTVYRVEISNNGNTVEEMSAIKLDSGDKWQQELTITLTRAGPDQEVLFHLYQDEEKEPSKVLNLWINVILIKGSTEK